MDFFTLTPCRLYDSRDGQGPLVGGFDRHVPINSHCGIPPDAISAALNITAVDPTADGTFSAYPVGVSPTGTTVVGYADGVNRASQAVLKVGSNGNLAVRSSGGLSDAVHLVVDVAGYFRPSAPVQQWRAWEQTITSTVDYTASGGNPFSEIELDVRLTNTSTGEAFVQGAWWDADDLAPRIFKFETALPTGTWAWQIENCTRNTVNCLSDGWTPSSGTVLVQSNTASGNPLYDRGFPIQFETVSGGETTVFSELVYPDGQAFNWLGDTAWVAPPREYDPPGAAQPQTSSWSSYVQDRKSKGFSGLHVAPALAWQGPNPLPLAMGFSFSGCSGAIPRTCSKPIKPYWAHFKNMVKQANDAGLVVAIHGVMNPTGIDRPEPYPDEAGAKAFARYLVALLKGRAVIYSPSFDDFADLQPNGVPGQRQLINAVGLEIKRKLKALTGVPRKDIRTNHLAGGVSNCDTYRSFATVPSAQQWLSSYFFQSGHGGANGGTAGACPSHVANATDVQDAMRRAREMALTMSSYASPSLPAVNAEGPYDHQGSVASDHPNVDNRFRLRHAAYLSALSNAAGFTYGANGLTREWTQPADYFNLPSAFDIARLKVQLLGRDLTAQHSWILNQPAAEQKKMVLASVGTDLLLAYLPGGTGAVTSITIQTVNYSDLHCGPTSPWRSHWFDPASDIDDQEGQGCTQETSAITLKRPLCVVSGARDCDFFLELARMGPGGPGPGEAASIDAPSIGVWAAPNSDQSSAIVAALGSAGERGQKVVLSPAGRAHQSAPRVAALGEDHLVVWQAHGLDGSLGGIFGSVVTSNGEVKGGPFKINDYTEHDQVNPALAPGRKEALVVWSSFGQEGSRHGIYGRMVTQDSETPLRQEIRLSEAGPGDRRNPQVVADSAGYWVGWEVMDDNAQITAVELRRLDGEGRALGGDVRVRAVPGEQVRLMALDNPDQLSVHARWWRVDAAGRFVGTGAQAATPTGLVGSPYFTGAADN